MNSTVEVKEPVKPATSADKITHLKFLMATAPNTALVNVMDGRMIMDILEEQEARIKRIEKFLFVGFGFPTGVL